jgi:hypothetical protein
LLKTKKCDLSFHQKAIQPTFRTLRTKWITILDQRTEQSDGLLLGGRRFKSWRRILPDQQDVQTIKQLKNPAHGGSLGGLAALIRLGDLHFLSASVGKRRLAHWQ